MADSGTYDQATITRRQKIAEQMLAQSSRPPVIRNPVEGLGYLANVGADAFALNRLDKQAAEARKADTAALMSILNGGGGAQPSAVASPSPAPAMPPPSPTVIGANGSAKPDAQGVYDSDAVMMPAAADSSQPRGIRNNNPLNIEAGSFTQGQPGFSGSDGRFARFAEPQQGIDAAGKLLDTYQTKHGLNTVRGIISRWAPSSENDTNGYVTSVAGRMGVDPDQPLGPEHRQPLIQAMGQFENGRPIGGKPAVASAMSPMAFSGEPTPSAALPPPAAPAPAAPSPSAPAAAPPAAPGTSPTGIPDQQRRAIAALMMATPGSPAQQLGLQLAAQSLKPHDYRHQTLPDGTILQVDPTGKQPPKVVYQGPTKPQFTQIGEDILGNKKFGFVDSTTRKVSDVAGNPIGAGGTGTGSTDIPKGPDGNPLSGQDLLKHLEKNDPLAAAGVKGIIAGDMNAGGRNLQKLLPLAKLVDPSMEQFDYQARSKTRVNYTSGPGAQEVKAINTAIGHADQLATISPKLGGVDVMPGVLNPLIQGTRRNLGDKEFQDAKRDWDAKAETLATEVSKALNGGQPHVADKEHWRQILQGASSPTERSAALKSVMGILESRLSASANTYNQGMGTTREGLTFLTPENKDRYDRLLKTGGAASEAKPAAATGPSRDEIEAEMKRRGLAP